MAAAGTQYTVFGFDGRIDWKPTVFVDGLPKNRVCSACGLVSAVIAVLPCRHLLCNRCYDNGADGERSCCLLDKDVCKPEDVIWTTFTRENLLGRKIQCWNSSHGCNVLGAVSKVVDHFEKDCRYHAVMCFRCKQSMTYKELLGHLETNDCSILDASTASSSHGISDATITLFLQPIGELRDKLSSLQTCCHETKELISGQVQVFRERAAADRLVAESLQTLDNTIKESMGQGNVGAGRTAEELAQMRNSITAITNTLRDVEVLVNEMKTSLGASREQDSREISASCLNLQRELKDLSASPTKEFEKNGKSLEALQRIVNESAKDKLDIKESLKRLNERLNDQVCLNIAVLGEAAKVVSGLPLCTCEPLIWTVEKWSDLKSEATSKGEAIASAEKPKYFYGYFILPGIRIVYADGNLKLYLLYHLHQGGYDSILHWPFEEDVHLYVLNKEGKEIPHAIKQKGKNMAVKSDERPTTERNLYVKCWASVNVTDMEKNGCVIDDKVSLKFTVSRL